MAHQDAIRDLTLVRSMVGSWDGAATAIAVASCSFDCTARVWSLSGEQRGDLAQGNHLSNPAAPGDGVQLQDRETVSQQPKEDPRFSVWQLDP